MKKLPSTYHGTSGHRGLYHRYLILCGLCYVNLALFFCIEIPSGIQDTIIKVFNIDSSKYNLFFSSYTWSEVILSIGSGILIDRVIGHRVGYLMFLIVAVVGQGISTAGAFLNIYEVTVVGRFIMGCGTGTLKSLFNIYIARWFKNKEILFATSLAYCCCRLGASLGLLIPQLVYESQINQLINYNQVGFSFLVGFLFMSTTLLIGAIATAVDFIASIEQKKPQFQMRRLKLKELKHFNLRFLIGISLSACYYSLLFLFVANAQLYLMSKFGFSTTQANMANILVFLVPVIVTPIIGYLVDMIGYNTWWGIVGIIFGMITHLLFNIISTDFYILPYLLCCLLSVSYSFFAISIFVLPTFIVPEHLLTTAYNIYNIVHSVIYTCSSIISGAIVDYAGYMWLESFYLFILYFILLMLIVLTVLDRFVEDQQIKVNKPGRLVAKMIKRKK